MKYIVQQIIKTLVFFTFIYTANAQTKVYVPDVDFRNGLINHIPSYNITQGTGDTVIVPNIITITDIKVPSLNIYDMTGIEAFTNLVRLDCYNAQVSSLDISVLPNLTYLKCGSNQYLTTLVLNNTIDTLDCDGANISTLNVSSSPNLRFLNCSYNNLTTLDVSSLSSLKVLLCAGNPITSLTLSNSIEKLDCSQNNLTALDVSNLTSLKELQCNFIPSLTSLTLNSTLEILGAGITGITTLDVSTLHSLKMLQCFDTPSLTTLILGDSLTFVECFNTGITTLDISVSPLLQALMCYDIPTLSEIIINGNDSLRYFNSFNTNVSSLDFSSCIKLEQLRCGNSPLTSLIVGTSTLLWELNCPSTKLTTLDVSHVVNLQQFYCSNDSLTTLNLWNNTALTLLECQNNIYLDTIYMPSGYTTFIDKDAGTTVITVLNNINNPSVSTGTTGLFGLGNTNVLINFTNATDTDGSLNASTNNNPTVVGGLPSGVDYVFSDKYWTITNTGLTNFMYDITLDLTGIDSITNFNALKILKRSNATSVWQDVVADLGATISYNAPKITISGLTSFSDFAIGGDNANNPLPVTLLTFTATIKNSNVELFWNTASEINNEKFEVQKAEFKHQKPEWKTVGLVKGNGTSYTSHHYTFIDKNILAEKYLYRLKQTDTDGKVMYSTEVLVHTIPTSIKVEQNFPNPFNPTTTINYQLPVNTFVTLKVYNILGEEVATLVNEEKSAGIYQVKFDGSSLSSGIYFYKLTAGKISEIKKMMLVK